LFVLFTTDTDYTALALKLKFKFTTSNINQIKTNYLRITLKFDVPKVLKSYHNLVRFEYTLALIDVHITT